jgi:hypothetical protein
MSAVLSLGDSERPVRMNFAVCPDDGNRLRADPDWRHGYGPLLMRCPACGKRYTLTDNGVVEAGPETGLD